MKVVINSCYGGYGLSPLAIKALTELKKIEVYPFVEDLISKYKQLEWDEIIEKPPFMVHFSSKPIKDGKLEEESYFSYGDIPRNDKDLVKVVELLGKKANGNHAELTIVEIPDDVKWHLDDYDGIESVHEDHQSWS